MQIINVFFVGFGMDNGNKKSIMTLLPWREAVAFIVLACLMVIGLVAAAKIPKDRIIENLGKSAELYRSNPRFFNALDGVDSSMIDWYADAILLDMDYYYDNEAPLESVMRSNYYHDKHKTINDSFYEAVKYNKNPNMEYIRYWHGSNAIVRPLLKWLSAESIYRLNAVLLLVLLLLMATLMLKDKLYVPLIGITVGLAAVSVWFVPMSLEYTWNFLLLPICVSAVVMVSEKEKRSLYGVIFLSFGMLTNYFDFLTTETLTFTVPVLVLLFIEKKKQSAYSPTRLAIRTAVAWGCGYAGAWILKWILASSVLRENVMPYVAGHISERVGGVDESINVGPIAFFVKAVTRNLKSLFPFDYGAIGVLAGVILILLIMYMAFVYRGGEADRSRILIYLCIGCIPYVRYLVLHNHAYKHFFFTYRAQAGTGLAIVLILNELKVWDTFRRKRLHRNRK